MATLEDTLVSIRKQLERLAGSELDITHDFYLDNDEESKPLPDIHRSDDYLLEKYLTPKTTFNTDWLNELQNVSYVDKMQFIPELYSIPEFTSRMVTKYKRSGLNGKVVGLEEVVVLPEDRNAKNSLRLNRQMGSKLDFVRGRAGFMPFAPGGIETADIPESKFLLHRDDKGLFDIPPGFDRGLKVNDIEIDVEESNELKEKEVGEEEDENLDEEDNIEEIDEDIDEVVDDDDELLDDEVTSNIKSLTINDQKSSFSSAIDDLLPQDITFGRTETATAIALAAAGLTTKVKEWAHVVDVNKTITNFNELVPNPAREFPFELDTFQKEAVYHLEQGDSVFVAAHTSAGKTVVAEYAISMANRNMTKTIYTSPIKALSNQKYRDFKQIYDDVGILTGDVQINPEASCLIMTTEILRSMLYRGADLIRDVEFVIFDEVHYVNDQDRGVVWEEVIIMLPDHVKFILLSATVPNTYEFANWIGRTKQKDIYVISTYKRPVPLEHYLWAKNNKYKIVDENKNFLEQGWKAANDALMKKNDAGTGGGVGRGGVQGARGGRGGAQGGRGGGTQGGRGGNQNSRGGRGGRGGAPNRGGNTFNSGGAQNRRNNNFPGKTTLTQLCHHLQKNTLLPAVIFVFSKKRCEEFATMLNSLDYCSAREKSEIHMFIDQAVSRLKTEDRNLPQILLVRDLLSRGIGIHHGGLLPIMKEVIEILFSKSLVKVLFATETFAMGLNLPTRTVVFASTGKHDGRSFRQLLPGEYTQMAGRAGRRGLDTTGTVILMCNDPEAPLMSQLKAMLLGTPTKLQSQFRLTYNMILNLLRIEALKVEDMIKRSFSENSSQVLLPEHEKNVKASEETLIAMKRDACPTCDPDIEQTHENIVKYQELSTEIINLVVQSPYGRRTIVPGKLLVFLDVEKNRRCLGILTRTMIREQKFRILSVARMGNTKKEVELVTKLPYLPMIPGYVEKHLKPFTIYSRFRDIVIDMSSVEFITTMKIDCVLPDLILNKQEEVKRAIQKLDFCLRFQNKWNLLSFSGVKDAQVLVLLAEREVALSEILSSQSMKCKTFSKSYSQVHEEYLIKKKIESLKQLISDQNLELLPDYEQRIQVLKDLNYIDDELNVLIKGRVACEISSGFELIVTELVLDNFLGDYEPEEIVALLSAFVFEGNTKIDVESVTPRLDQGRARILEIVSTTNQVFESHQVLMTQEEAEFTERMRFGLMEVVYEWARGMTFNSITQLTDVQEGTIVRVITRMDEICREVMAAARIIGDSTLYEKMALAQEKIKRDIVFCASLYI